MLVFFISNNGSLSVLINCVLSAAWLCNQLMLNNRSEYQLMENYDLLQFRIFQSRGPVNVLCSVHLSTRKSCFRTTQIVDQNSEQEDLGLPNLWIWLLRYSKGTCKHQNQSQMPWHILLRCWKFLTCIIRYKMYGYWSWIFDVLDLVHRHYM